MIGRIFCFFFLCVQFGYSQVSSAVSAQNRGNLKQAKAIVDSLCVLKDYQSDAELWYVRGMVFETIFKNNDTLINYINDHVLKISLDAYQKAQNAVKNPKYAKLASTYLDTSLSKTIYNESLKVYQYTIGESRDLMNLYISIKPLDTLGYLQLVKMDEKLANFSSQKNALKKLIELGYSKPFVYRHLLRIYDEIENKDFSFDSVIAIAKLKFPELLDFRKIEVQRKVKSKKYSVAILKLDTLSKFDPSNKYLYLFNIGSIYQNIDSIAFAKKYYQMSVDEKSDFFDPYFNLGGIYYQQAGLIYEKINKLDYFTYQKTGNQLKQEANLIAKQALQYFEKAWSIKQDAELKPLLIDLYRNLNMSVKLK